MQEPEGPPNKKGRPFGHGTTSHARRERRAHMQWSALEKDDPASSQCLVKHLAALEKAQKKCQEKLATSLAQSLAKEGGGGSKHLGKDGNPRKVRLTPAGAGEQASSSSSGLKKPEKKRANKSDLEKSTKGLENPKKSKGLEKPTGTGLEKPTKPVVIVDWYNTLFVGDSVPAENITSLEKLCASCHVPVLSFVATKARKEKVLQDMELMLPDHLQQVICKETCWKKVGRTGKCAWAWEWGAEAIFDDCKAILKESMEWGLETYPINTMQEGHAWAGGGYETFALAVEAYLKDH